MKKLILAVGVIALLSSCNKTRLNSNRFSGEIWKITSITIDGVAEEESHLPVLEFEDCDNYEKVCMGHWIIENEDAHFAWQFSDNGETLTISNQSESDHSHEHDDHGDDHDHVDPIEQCQDLSGSYTVEVSKRMRMEINSTESIGYSGVEVKIAIERID